jgi:hypothetical protein
VRHVIVLTAEARVKPGDRLDLLNPMVGKTMMITREVTTIPPAASEASSYLDLRPSLMTPLFRTTTVREICQITVRRGRPRPLSTILTCSDRDRDSLAEALLGGNEGRP